MLIGGKPQVGIQLYTHMRVYCIFFVWVLCFLVKVVPLKSKKGVDKCYINCNMITRFKW
jgi:hypothetical protein